MKIACLIYLSLFLTESHGHRDDWNVAASFVVESSSVLSWSPVSFIMSSVLALLKSIFWASLARLSDIDNGLKY